MFLDQILAQKRAEIAERSNGSMARIQQAAARAPEPRDFLAALKAPGLGVIAEIKRRSPSKGDLAPGLDPAAQAARYQEGGCVAVSVLTDGPSFGAQPGDLEAVRSTVSVPVLRKDFLLSKYQIWEARAMGADAVLLIVAALEPERLAALAELAQQLGMCPLVEAHTAGELLTTLAAGIPAIGINNRDLRTFKVDLDTTRKLRRMVPEEITVVSESGFATPVDAAKAASWGVDAILVGEALVRNAAPANLLRALSAAGSAVKGGAR